MDVICWVHGEVSWSGVFGQDWAAGQLRLDHDSRRGKCWIAALKSTRVGRWFSILPETTMKITKDAVTISGLKDEFGNKSQTVHLKDANAKELELFIDKLSPSIKVIHTPLPTKESRELFLELREKKERIQKREEQLMEMDERLRWKDEQLIATKEQLRRTEEQLRGKNEQVTEKDNQLREKDKQLIVTKEQLRWMEEQVREKSEQQQNLQRQLTTLEGDKKKESAKFQEQLNVKLQEFADLEKELRDREQDNVILQRDLSAAKKKLSEYESQLKTRDWVLCRDEVQLSDESLGAGTLGRVVRGRYCGCVVAIKQLHQPTLTRRERRLFEREMDIASRCRHPCLLQFIGATQDERPLFVTEIMESSLRKLLDKRHQENRHLTETEIIVISLDVARALNYLHLRKPEPIVHRDVSSANVLLWKQNNQWRGKLGDYGTAKFLQETMTVSPGAMIYGAPEIGCRFKQTVKIDVYSFGVLFCEMCTGELPESEKHEEKVRLVNNKKFGELILWCIEEDPEMRPSMEEVIEKLEQLNAMS